MKEQIAILGLGQAGSNVANIMEELGYNTAYVNTSKEDLNSIKNAKHKIHVRNAEGASKNRQAVLSLVAESIEEIIENITSVLTQKFIVVCFSAGGGTGSGLSTFICSYLAQVGKIVVPVVILPDDTLESIRACENAYNMVAELNDVSGLGATFLLDNSRHADKFAINNRFARDLDAFLNINNCSNMGNLDKSEIKTLLSTSGIAVITKQSKTKSTASDIIGGIRNSIYAEIESKTLMYIGISTSNKSLLPTSLEKEFGIPYDSFIGYSESTTVCILTGLQWPLKRLKRFEDKVNSMSKVVQENMTIKNSITFNTLNTISTIKQESKPTVTSSRDLLMQFMR